METAQFRCMCGFVHKLPRARALEGLGVAHWKCTDCGRRFVLTHTPPELFAPVYLDPSVRSVEVRETGSAVGAVNLKNALPPPAIEFKCRCGHAITAHSWMYGGTAACPGCKTNLLLALKYSTKRKQFVIVPEYPPKSSSA
jgi:DNA-directed RNA polymerase subunit RPC12/RpoP